jgi:hypothetical protein
MRFVAPSEPGENKRYNVAPSAEFGVFVDYNAISEPSVVYSMKVTELSARSLDDLNGQPELISELFDIQENGVTKPLDCDLYLYTRVPGGIMNLGGRVTQVSCFIEIIPVTPKLQPYL